MPAQLAASSLTETASSCSLRHSRRAPRRPRAAGSAPHRRHLSSTASAPKRRRRRTPSDQRRSNRRAAQKNTETAQAAAAPRDGTTAAATAAAGAEESAATRGVAEEPSTATLVAAAGCEGGASARTTRPAHAASGTAEQQQQQQDVGSSSIGSITTYAAGRRPLPERSVRTCTGRLPSVRWPSFEILARDCFESNRTPQGPLSREAYSKTYRVLIIRTRLGSHSTPTTPPLALQVRGGGWVKPPHNLIFSPAEVHPLPLPAAPWPDRSHWAGECTR